jgi:hypothetical protein
MFSSQRSVRQLNIDEEGIECKESLKEPTNVAKLLREIIVGLEKEETEGASERKIKKESEEKENGVKGCFGFVTALCQPSRNRKTDNEWDTKMVHILAYPLCFKLNLSIRFWALLSK